jgi:hypothetical protein
MPNGPMERTDTSSVIWGFEWMGDVFELQETGFFKTILNGRFGTVESFVLPVSLDRAIADESAEVIAFTGEADTFIRHPAGTEPDFDQPRNDHTELSFIRRWRSTQCDSAQTTFSKRGMLGSAL